MKKLLLSFLTILIMTACANNVPEFSKIKETDELQIFTEKKGTGDLVKSGDFLVIHYDGYLLDGTKFDSSVDRGTPFNVTIGVQQVIEGWDKGVIGMKIGEKRRLVIPYSMGYGEYGAPPVIPAKSTLVFDIELIDIKNPSFIKGNK